MGSAARLLNVIDVEATCWAGHPPPGHVSEIIEIGLTVVDISASERISRHRIVVRPQRSLVSAFCSDLTGPTQADVDTGVAFREACRTLAAEHSAGTRDWASGGDYDRKQFLRQCQAAGTEYPFGPRHVNAKAVFAATVGFN
jgi:inhibitor of KinA sporulation pathway (predicted exonuclease)